MSETIIDKIEALLRDGALALYEHRVLPGFRKCESEIEKLLYVSLWSAGVWRDHISIEDHDTLEALRQAECSPSLPILSPQIRVGRYRVDFMIRVAGYPGDDDTFIVIECDGYEFHERTKEQAQRDKARDRALIADGIQVIRFTGSEVWQRAGECAEEILALLVDAHFRTWLRHEERLTPGAIARLGVLQ